MFRKFITGVASIALLSAPTLAQNASSGSPRVQGVPAGYGDPLQVTIRNTDGSAPVAIPVSMAAPATGGATSANQTSEMTLIGPVTETAPASDTASSGLNGRQQRIAQRLTTINTTLGTPFQAGGSIGNTTFAATQSGTWNITNVSGTISLPTGASTSAAQTSAQTSLTSIATNTTNAATTTLQTAGNVLLGAVTETAPASDTASSGINGRLQRIAQNLTTMNATALPAGTAVIGAVQPTITTYRTGKSLLRVVAAANNNAQNLSTGQRVVYNVQVSNRHATNWAVVRLYNKASTPTVGTDVPVLVVACPPVQTCNWTDPDIGSAFGTGLGLAITTGFADNDNTAVATINDVIVTIQYF